MSNRPDKCRWCGLHEVDDGTLDTVFACGSSWRCRDMWFQSTGCEEIVELRKRVAAAIAEAQKVWQFGLEHNRSIRCVLAADMDRVIAILENKQ